MKIIFGIVVIVVILIVMKKDKITCTYMDTPPKSTRNLSFRAVYSTNSLYLLYIPTRQCK
jgi:hypothetical protein